MYKYGIVKGVRFCMVYVCTGSNEERMQFAKDVEKLGMDISTYTKNETQEPFTMAIDRIDDTKSMQESMTSAIHEISTAATVEEALEEIQEGPFPTVRTFLIPIAWRCCGTAHTMARSMKEAMAMATSGDELPEGEFIPNSLEVDSSRPIQPGVQPLRQTSGFFAINAFGKEAE